MTHVEPMNESFTVRDNLFINKAASQGNYQKLETSSKLSNFINCNNQTIIANNRHKLSVKVTMLAAKLTEYRVYNVMVHINHSQILAKLQLT